MADAVAALRWAGVRFSVGCCVIIPPVMKNDRWYESLFGAPPPANPARDTRRGGPHGVASAGSRRTASARPREAAPLWRGVQPPKRLMIHPMMQPSAGPAPAQRRRNSKCRRDRDRDAGGPTRLQPAAQFRKPADNRAAGATAAGLRMPGALHRLVNDFEVTRNLDGAVPFPVSARVGR